MKVEISPDHVLGVSENASRENGKTDGPYEKYALIVLTLVYVFSFADRQMLSILAEEIKHDTGASDAQLGFLYGTAFAIFYATFGIAFGRLADLWSRKRLISIGLGLWSLMTSLSGLASTFVPLAICRVGVGVGEATASPAAYSMIYDFFSTKLRTTAIGVYQSGAVIGGGIGLFLGGAIVEAWKGAWPDRTMAPLGLAGWQAAFLLVGAPGMLMALWVFTLREPVRGQVDGISSESVLNPFRETAMILASMLPVLNWWMWRRQRGGAEFIRANVVAALLIALLSWALIVVTGDVAQWVAIGASVYAALCWVQRLARQDPVIFGLIFRCRSLRYVIAAGGPAQFLPTALMFWAPTYLMRCYGVSVGQVGAVLGLGIAVSFAATILGGIFADWIQARTGKGKLSVWLVSMTVYVPLALLFLTSPTILVAYIAFFTMGFVIAFAQPPWISTLNDLMLPRGRATTSSFAFLVLTVLGIALGPYVVGAISDALIETGNDEGSALRYALLLGLVAPLIGITLVAFALRHVEDDLATLVKRAREAGESVTIA
jgi:MFS family permease